jgi:ATP/maltotriose-dependent transcriptional regulator MalT
LFISRNGGKAVFFVPPALVQKWHEEIEEFCRRVLASAPPRAVKRAAIKLKRESHEIVKSTSRFKRFSRGTTLLAKKCRLLVLDEAHKARKEGTVLHRCLKRFIRRKRNKLRLLLLTATVAASGFRISRRGIA